MTEFCRGSLRKSRTSEIVTPICFAVMMRSIHSLSVLTLFLSDFCFTHTPPYGSYAPWQPSRLSNYIRPVTLRPCFSVRFARSFRLPKWMTSLCLLVLRESRNDFLHFTGGFNMKNQRSTSAFRFRGNARQSQSNCPNILWDYFSAMIQSFSIKKK